jgi:hypothetical protein
MFAVARACRCSHGRHPIFAPAPQRTSPSSAGHVQIDAARLTVFRAGLTVAIPLSEPTGETSMAMEIGHVHIKTYDPRKTAQF